MDVPQVELQYSESLGAEISDSVNKRNLLTTPVALHVPNTEVRYKCSKFVTHSYFSEYLVLEQIIPPDSNQTLRSLLRNPLAKDVAKTKRDNGRALGKLKEDSDMIIRPGYSSESQFACRHCGKRYRWKSTMRRHELVECGEKCVITIPKLLKVKLSSGRNSNESLYQNQQSLYRCQNCGRSYKLKSSLRNHQKWECGKEPQFECLYCSYKAKQKMHMMRHMERLHKDIDYAAISETMLDLNIETAKSKLD
ncbi:hypothetical protein Trydic_g17151 [Trypoxylus dichotomus]